MLHSQNVQKCFFYHKQLPSTQDFAKKHQSLILSDELWITLAIEQTEGYGRRGNKWQHEKGNLAATFSWRETKTPPSAIQVADLICEQLPSPITLKWPNDLLFEGCKVGGVMIERDHDLVHVGVGINLKWHPIQSLDYPAAHLTCVIDPVALTQNIADAMIKGSYRDHKTIDRFAYIGTKVIIDGQEGIFTGVDEQGAALIEQQGITRSFIQGSLRKAAL